MCRFRNSMCFGVLREEELKNVLVKPIEKPNSSLNSILVRLNRIITSLFSFNQNGLNLFVGVIRTFFYVCTHNKFTLLTHHLFRPQSKKPQSLVYDADKDDARKTRKKLRNASQLKASTRTDGQKPSKRKNAKLDWQRAVNLNSRGKDARITRTSSFLTIEADSLKLLATSTVSKQPQRPQRKLESRRKFRGVGAVASTCVGVGVKTSIDAKTTRTRACRRDVFCESTTSDDSSSDSGKLKVVKKKQKKKKQQQQQHPPSRKTNRGTEQSKRVCSAKTSRNNVWELFFLTNCETVLLVLLIIWNFE